jgi:1-acyl-sn-glycerol-3-phosphate acyltransferase
MITAVTGFLRFAAGVVISIVSAAVIILTLPIERKSGRVFHAISRAWARTVLAAGGVRVTLRGVEKLDPGRNYVYVSNHASMFDIPAILAHVPGQVRIVYKKELEVIPVFGWGLKWGSYIGIDRRRGGEAMRSLEEAVGKIRNGASVLLYAEGTRTQDGRLQPFKRGAFNIAVRAGIPVVPLTVNGTYPILPKGSVVVRPRPVELVLETPIPVEGTGKDEEMRLMDKVHEAIARNYVDQSALQKENQGA